MAKSPVGGSRAYLKGRIGSDVYSLGKDGKGKRQQIVRALPEAVTNPRTSSQMVNRMIMSTIAQAVAAMAPIIDHSFDGISVGQPSISEFTRRNYALLKAGNGSYNLFNEKGIKPNTYIVSVGKAKMPAIAKFGQSENEEYSGYGKWGCVITIPKGVLTVGDLKEALGFGNDNGYLTVLGCNEPSNQFPLPFYYGRFRFNPANADSVTITDEMANDLFLIDGNFNGSFIDILPATAEKAGEILLFCPAAAARYAQGAIFSKHVGGKWIHSSCQLSGIRDDDKNFDAALATYPVGTEEFLNGGDL